MYLGLFSGLDVLGEISLSSTRQSGFAKAARECLLDSNLPAKYAMTGSLSCNNIIQDGFYDCGPVRNRAACIASQSHETNHNRRYKNEPMIKQIGAAGAERGKTSANQS